jgi:trehalose 6-phosphate phosphatase
MKGVSRANDTVSDMSVDGDRIAAVSKRLTGALIAVDFDGTLAPIVKDPQASRPVPGVIHTLAGLGRAGAQVAIVTGRDARTVLELGHLSTIPGLIISGLHGAERWEGGELSTREEPAGIAVLRRSLPAVLAEVDPGVWLEDKRLSLVVHTRRASDPDRAWAALQPVITSQASAHGLEVHPGKQVLEIRIPHLSKADAVASLLSDDTTAAVFAGDDVGDVPAILTINEWALNTGRPSLTIAVGEVAELRAVCDGTVDSPVDLADLLRELLNQA